MKEVTLTRGYIALVDDEDYERVMAAGSWYAYVQSERKEIYARRMLPRNGKKGNQSSQSLHRFIVRAIDSKLRVDHKDHDGLNCQKNNLRICTPAQNRQNSLKPKNARTSKYKGVSLISSPWKLTKPWLAQIQCEGRSKNLGQYKTEAGAAKAYDAAARRLHGEFACINFPKEAQ